MGKCIGRKTASEELRKNPMYKIHALPAYQAMPAPNVASFTQLWHQQHVLDTLSTAQETKPKTLQEALRRGQTSSDDPSHRTATPEYNQPPKPHRNNDTQPCQVQVRQSTGGETHATKPNCKEPPNNSRTCKRYTN